MRTLDLMKALAKYEPSVRFDFCVLSGLEGELDSTIRSLGGQVHYLKLDLDFPKKFKRLIKENSYAAIHSHVQLFSGYLLKLASQMGVPVRIAHLHTTGDSKTPTLIKKIQNRLMKRWLYLYATDIIGVSQGALDAFYKIANRFKSDDRCKLIYDAIDPEAFELSTSLDHPLGVPSNGTIVIHVGRIEPVKNHPRLIEIFSDFLKKVPDAQLLLVGNSEKSARESLSLMAKKLNIETRVHFLGSRSDVPALLLASDLMIFPSLWEGLPGVVLEASSVGLPVISSDLPGSRELGKFFPSIRCIELSEPNSEWVQLALETMKQPRVSRLETLYTLKKSPFSIEPCLRQLLPIWKRPLD